MLLQWGWSAMLRNMVSFFKMSPSIDASLLLTFPTVSKYQWGGC